MLTLQLHLTQIRPFFKADKYVIIPKLNYLLLFKQ